MRPTRSMLLVIALLASWSTPDRAVVRADQSPEDATKIETLTVEEARKLVEFGGEQVLVNRPIALPAAAAQVLAGFTGDSMVLSGVTTLDADAAKMLAGFKGQKLFLSGLTTLDADTAKALAGFKGQQLYLSGVDRLDPAAAQALVAIQTWKGQLSGFVAFESSDSIAVAAALATRKGRLALPNLERISPKTLSALLEKEDVEIPPLDSLEIIPEPDGTPTDDFVVPEEFPESQAEKR